VVTAVFSCRLECWKCSCFHKHELLQLQLNTSRPRQTFHTQLLSDDSHAVPLNHENSLQGIPPLTGAVVIGQCFWFGLRSWLSSPIRSGPRFLPIVPQFHSISVCGIYRNGDACVGCRRERPSFAFSRTKDTACGWRGVTDPLARESNTSSKHSKSSSGPGAWWCLSSAIHCLVSLFKGLLSSFVCRDAAWARLCGRDGDRSPIPRGGEVHSLESWLAPAPCASAVLLPPVL